ncbi:restriction endonuclease [Aminobacter sp. NyZ550]|uniref:restriction endonuclease n=1 Tax=Aminobacter sp. NyZ550 TaxID=2979870 RepID=UPI0021D5E220|nr:restriction endonuclease [Aminobacter sp. NyZ550]WAX94272.1 restriction endonuclease [Aminobacter sp. NyZ550]
MIATDDDGLRESSLGGPGELDTVVVKSRYLNHIDLGNLTARHSADGSRVLRFYVDLRHDLLKLHKELNAPELFLLQHKVNALVAQWDEKTDEFQKRRAIFGGKASAEQLTLDATAAIDRLSGILSHTLGVNDRINWEAMKDRSPYSGQMTYDKPEPHRLKTKEPQYVAPEIGFFDKLFGRARTKLETAATDHHHVVENWRQAELKADQELARQRAAWTAAKAAFEAQAQSAKQEFFAAQVADNAKIDRLAAGVAAGDPSSVIEHASLVLDESDYDDLFEKAFEIEYDRNAKTLLLEYRLPSPDDMPRVKAVRFVAASGEFKETYVSDRELKANYDHVGYQICLRTLHELFEADEHTNLERILFNGYANYIDRSSGRDVSATIMSVLVDRKSFLEVDLSRVDPKACFKSLKGVSASTLSALAPIAPVMKLNKEDRRFIDARDQAEFLDDTTNLAAMDWEDFEHLVREVFEKEFAARGGEVRITQSSNDGGVDAVAFDPDPITGGKIVIQAKRYTRTVGVAAVRDLYGTMQHEQASRGILVTTADYGPDAHKFSSGKPITLMTGANLLHLLGRHGINAKIDLREARKTMNLRDFG